MSRKLRAYERTHPWITFDFSLERAPGRLMLLLGEAQSKCQHIAGAPLRPDVSAYLHQIYLVRGIRATTAIEGNTLTEEDIKKQMEGTLEVPPSKEYLAQETKNIEKACNFIADNARKSRLLPLNSQTIKFYNRMAIHKIPSEDHVVPGEFRETIVGVAHYRGVPTEDVSYLVDLLCDWLDRNFRCENPADTIVYGILKAVIAHIYIAWIHPFGDGNGRTARLVEYRILIESGVPLPSAHLLSDHYNNTRNEYYRQLDRTSKSKGDIFPFLLYALQGFVDGLKEQIETIQAQQFEIIWQNYVHEFMRSHEHTPTGKRRKHIVMDMLRVKTPLKASEVRHMTPRQSREYEGKTRKTVTRDVNWLLEHGLLVRENKGVRPDYGKIKQFLPMSYSPKTTDRY